MPRLLLLSLLLAPVALAQDGAVSFTETDQAEYAYGETIELRYTISNESDEAFSLTGSNDCQAGFTYGTLHYPIGCDLEFVTVDFPPHSSRTWVWHLTPHELGVPEAEGEQSITAYYGIYADDNILPASVTFTAPLYLGGRVIFRLEDGLVLDDVEDVMEALNAIIIQGGGLWYIIETEGVALAEAVATYGSDPRFRFFEVHRDLLYSDIILTDDEASAPPVQPALTAAHPNPFTASTSFALMVPAPGPARVEVFDLLGRRVGMLHDGPLASGAEHHFTFHAADLPAGLYVVRATGEGFTETRRMTLAR